MTEKSDSRSASQFLLKILNLMDEPIFAIKENGILLFGNSSFYSLLKHSKQSNLNAADFIIDFEPGMTFDGLEELILLTRTGLSIRNQVSVKKLTTGVYLIKVIKQPAESASSSTASDADKIASKKELALTTGIEAKTEMFHGQRLQMLGTMAGGVAHDFNNLLTGILGHTSYLKAILPEKGDHAESLDAIESGARRSSIITQQILKFARLGDQDDIAACDLKQIVKSTCGLLRAAINRAFDLTFHLPDEDLIIMGVETKISQVIANLVMNAKDALEASGKIEVGIEIVQNKERIKKAYVNFPPSAKRFARLYVSDNGKGIPPEVIDHIFVAFFTTKKDKGTGLGLATVESIVKSFRGTMEVSSQVGKGTTMSVYFPLYEAAEQAEVSQPADSQGTDRKINAAGKKVLVVDDEFPVRNVVAVSLKHLGFDVSMASGGEEALEMYLKALKSENKSDKYDLIILDMLMPGMTGDELFVRLRMKDSQVRALIMSGYASEEALERVMMGGAKGFIQKPFTIEELMEKISQCW